MLHFSSSSHHEDSMAALDQYVAPGLRLWMLIGLICGVLLIMIIIVCCFMRIRIPRTKREIELIHAQRKMRKAAAAAVAAAHNTDNNMRSSASCGRNSSNYSESENKYDNRTCNNKEDKHYKNPKFIMNSQNVAQNSYNTVKREPLPSRNANV